MHTLGEELGTNPGPFVTTAVGTTSSLVCSRFIRSTLAASAMERWTILIEDGDQAGEQAQIRDGGVAKATGTLSTSDAFSGVIQAGVSFSLYGVLPPLADITGPSLQGCLNKAQRLIPIEDDIPMLGVTGQEIHYLDQGAYPWWVDDTQIVQINRPVTTVGAAPERYWGDWHWQADGESISLTFPGGAFNDGDQWSVRVTRPANSILRQGGSWVDQTTQTAGFVNLDDETKANVDDVVLVAKAYAYEALAEMSAPGRTVEDWRTLASRYRRRANRLLHGDIATDENTGVVHLRPVSVGGRRGTWAKGWAP